MPGRRGGRRLRRAGGPPGRALPPAVRHHGAVCDLRRPDRREQGLHGALRLLRALQPHRARRPAPGARGQDDPAHPAAPAHPPPRVPRRRAEVRRDGRGRRAHHAVVFREPLDGRARGVGDRQAGARQRQVRRAEGAGDPQRRGALLRELRRVRGGAPRHHVGARAAARAWRERARVLPHALRLARDRAEVPRHARPPGEDGERAAPGDGAAARVLRAAPPHAAARRRCGGTRSGGSGPAHDAAGRPPGARHARLRRRHRPRGARHPARAARRRATSRTSSAKPPIRASRISRATTASSSRRARPTTCCCTTSRSARRRRAWRSRCPIAWRSSTTTSRRPSTSSACTTCSWSCAISAAASSRPTCRGASWRSATRSSTGRSSRPSASPTPACSRSSRLLAPGRRPPIPSSRATSTTSG